jgi:hypothetical protein
MYRRNIRKSLGLFGLVLAVGAAALVADRASSARADDLAAAGIAAVPVGGKIQADNACYVRLPGLPEGRYGGLGAYNPDTGVLVYAGGAEKRTDRNTIAYSEMWAIKLDGSMDAWAPIPYSPLGGYLRVPNAGCREMTSVSLGGGRWASVGGKSGCDGTTAQYGDIKELEVGASADPAAVRWVPNTGADLTALPAVLASNRFRLSEPFAVYDATRDRIVFGQGAFNVERDEPLTRRETYYATLQGMNWTVRQMRPTGAVPAARFGACAAYVSDPATGVDGVFVLGGQQGGPPNTPATTYKEVWWLDFKGGPEGAWTNISDRIGNWDAFGYRREGACAYDPGTKHFYSWMGRADGSIADGASHSGGIWRVSLAQLADPAAKLTWERLAKDNLTDVTGVRIVPNVYDLKNKRFFALGGRNGLNEYTDAWVIYPDVVGDACGSLDPYAPYRNPATPTGVPVPTITPPPVNPEVCDLAKANVPAAVIGAALASPGSVVGHGQLCNPNVPASTINHTRDRLSLEFSSRPYHPLYNNLVWKCGCP